MAVIRRLTKGWIGQFFASLLALEISRNNIDHGPAGQVEQRYGKQQQQNRHVYREEPPNPLMRDWKSHGLLGRALRHAFEMVSKSVSDRFRVIGPVRRRADEFLCII